MQSGSRAPDRGTEPDSVADAVGAESNRNRESGDAVDSGTSPETDGCIPHTNEARDQREASGESPTGTDERVADLERRIADLEADLDAVRGLLDGVDAVDEAVERRASTALAKVEALEAQVGTQESGLVCERLPHPEDSDPDAADGGDADPDAEDHTPERVSPSERASAMPRADGLRNRDVGRLTGGSPDTDGPVSTMGPEETRHGRTDLDAATADNQGTDAISSVGGAAGQPTNPSSSLDDSARGHDGATDTDSDPSLASRLRDAFR